MEIHSKKVRLVLLICFSVITFYLLFLITATLRNSRIFKKIPEQRETIKRNISKLTTFFSESKTLCKGNLLDQREYHYAKQFRGSYDNSRMISKIDSCVLLHYTFETAVECFDALYERNYSPWISSSSNKRLHFVFIGDSRVRQQFFNFLKLIPNYDQISQPNPIPFSFHGDIEVFSDILGLQLSFKWLPLINDTVIDTVRRWATDYQMDRPHLIFVGIAVWHMLQSEGADHQLYQKKLRRLAPFLGQLAKVSKVIWLNQFPTNEFYGETNAHNTDIFSEKIHRYNQAVRRILNDHKSVRIWDSSNVLAEEYVRGCALFTRAQLGTYDVMDPAYSYVSCRDYTHAGYSALSQATQLLFNDICNTFIINMKINHENKEFNQ